MDTILLGLSLIFSQGALFYEETLLATFLMFCINGIVHGLLPFVKKYAKLDLSQVFGLNSTEHLFLGIIMGYYSSLLYTDFSYPFVSSSVLSCLFWSLLNFRFANII